MLKLCAFVAVVVALLGFSNAYDENEKFCIRTEPLLLSDIKDHIEPSVHDPQCEIIATTLTVKEKESFVNTMCSDLTSSHQDYHYLRLHNGELAGRASYHEICSGKNSPLLAWVPYKQVRQHYAQELNPKEHILYIAKATDTEQERTELCHFQHSDLANKIADNLFTCIIMVFEDNFYGIEHNVNVLVEIKPIMYEIRNMTYLPWVNATKSYKTMLGKTTLQNTGRERKQIFGSINYAYVEKVLLNVSSVYQPNMVKLPLLFEHKGSVLEVDTHGVGGMDIKEKAYFGRTMDGRSTVNVDVIGQWAEHRKQFTGDIYEYFGYGIKRFHRQMHNGHVSFVRIESTEPVYEMIESGNMAKPTLHYVHKGKPQQQSSSFERLSEDASKTQVAGEWDSLTEGPTNDHPYPGFYPWFITSCIIVGIVIIIALIGFVRNCGKSEHQEYSLANKA